MLRLQLQKAERDALRYERYHYPNPRVQKKMDVVFFRHAGFPFENLCDWFDICENTARSYIDDYSRGGIEELKKDNHYRPQSELCNHRETIEGYFQQHPPATIAEAAAKIKELTGIQRSPTQVREFILRIGMRCRKVAAIPAKADPEVQEAFKKKR